MRKCYRPGIHLLILSVLTLILSCRKQDTPDLSASISQADRDPLIWIVTDIHYLSDDLYDKGPLFRKMNREGDGKNTAMLDSIQSAFIAEIKRERPAVLLVTGDLTFHGEMQSHVDLAALFRGVEALGTEVYVIPGNHDLNNPWAREYRNDKAYRSNYISPDEFKSIYKDFGYSAALSCDEASLSYLIEPFPGIRILMLDSNKYKRNEDLNYPEAGGALSPDTRTWIKEQADAAGREGSTLIAAMHHSLIEHNVMVSQGYTVDDSEDLIPFFSSLGIRLNLSGHIHIQDIIAHEIMGGPIYDIATGAFSVYPHGYGTLDLSGESWIYRSRTIDVERWAADSGSGDKRLLEFDSYSREYFAAFSRRMVENVLAGSSSEVTDRVAAAAEILNLNFFAGREGDNPEGIERELEEIFHRDASFLQDYLKSITTDSQPGDTFLEIKNP